MVDAVNDCLLLHDQKSFAKYHDIVQDNFLSRATKGSEDPPVVTHMVSMSNLNRLLTQTHMDEKNNSPNQNMVPTPSPQVLRCLIFCDGTQGQQDCCQWS